MARLVHLSALFFLTACMILFTSGNVSAHCDNYSGPVITDAKQALEKGDVGPLLKWVKKEDEEEMKNIFKKTIIVRAKGAEAKELADQYFFEKLVRIHRASEGATFTGLKSGPMKPIEVMADKALSTGNIDSLLNKVAAHVKEGIKERFVKATTLKKTADESSDAGRTYVEAYVTYLHYIIGIHSAVMAKSVHSAVEEHQKEHH